MWLFMSVYAEAGDLSPEDAAEWVSITAFAWRSLERAAVVASDVNDVDCGRK
jgi:hypothetical protein